MKVRWTDGSLRLRITPAELAALVDGQPVDESLALPGGRWDLRLSPAGARLAAQWAAGGVSVEVPVAEVARLAEPDREGVYAHSEGLRLMV